MEPTDTIGDDVTLYRGDALQVLPTLGLVDAVVTDPPYGIGEAAGKNKSRSCLATSRDYGDAQWDDKPCPPEALHHMRRLSHLQVVFGGNYFDLPPSSCWLVWDKVNGENDFADCELAWTNMNRAVRRIQHQWHGMIREGQEERFHPTQKPLRVMQWAIRQLRLSPGATILDPYMGSGTTGVAAMGMGFKFIGIERDPVHYATALRRLTHATGAGPGQLFGVQGAA